MRRFAVAVVLLGACQFEPGGSFPGDDGGQGAPDAARADASVRFDAAPGTDGTPMPDATPAPDAPLDAAGMPDAAPPPDARDSPIGLATTGSATTVGALGGSGGGPFVEDCPGGRVITGLFAKDNSFGLTRLGATCRRIALDAGGAVSLVDPVDTATHGSETSVVDIAPVNCPDGSVVAGFSGTSSSMNLVHSIRIRCASVSWDGVDYALGSLVEQPALGSSSSSGPPDAANCPAGQVAGGFSGRAGTILDRFELRCFALAPVYP